MLPAASKREKWRKKPLSQKERRARRFENSQPINFARDREMVRERKRTESTEKNIRHVAGQPFLQEVMYMTHGQKPGIEIDAGP